MIGDPGEASESALLADLVATADRRAKTVIKEKAVSQQLSARVSNINKHNKGREGVWSSGEGTELKRAHLNVIRSSHQREPSLEDEGQS